MTPESLLPASTPRPTADLVRESLRARLEALLRERDGVSASEPGAVHRMRVASRRVRETLRLSGPVIGEDAARDLLREGREVTRALGRLREEQVSRDLLLELSRGASGVAAVGFDYLLLRFERRIDRHSRAAARRLRRVNLERLERRVAEALDSAAPLTGRLSAAELIEPVARLASDEIQHAREQPDDERLHALRIAVKRLRYGVEVLAGHSPRGARYADALQRLQEALGRYHDLAVLVAHTTREKAKLTEAKRVSLAEAVDQARGRIVLAKRDALDPVGTLLARWPPGSLLVRTLRVVRAANRVPRAAPVAADASVHPGQT